ncbi:hypothetical protein D6C78_04596 [Aureobasidium pullulans]|uniref:Uncharacterized protein n=1 Tax=Aureobasidium pullulans TaxID=5580 RepID=A0A4T0C089_AURPU|nr:hypothetical protein D6C78_04596 [Aureobasidium pullulans]
MSSRIRKAVAYKRKHRNSITLGNLGRIDNAEMKSLKVKLHRSSLWLKRLEQTATKPEDLGLESFVKKTIEEKASFKAPILAKNIQPRMDDAFENSHERLTEKVSVASLVSDIEIMTFLEQKIKERINDAAMDIAKEIHKEREAEIEEQLEKVDEAATAESDDKASESSDE